MTKGGALKSVRIVTAAELEVNGGRFKLRQGPAIKVRGYTTTNIGSRMVKGGDAQPVYVLSDTDIRSGGGRWRVNAGQAIQVTDVIGDARGVIQGHAIPVFPVDDDGNYDSNFAGFLPTQLSGSELWLAADLGLSLADGASVDLWPDQSGNGNNATQVGIKRPTYHTGIINSKPIVRANGTSGSMVIAINVPNGSKTYFAVVDPTTIGNSDYLFDSQTGRLLISLNTNVSNIGWFDGGWKNVVATVDEWQILVWVLTAGGNGEVFKNGVSLGVAAYTQQAIGGSTALFSDFTTTSAFTPCDLAEFGIYDSALSVVDRQSLETYLSNKYGIAI